MSTIASTPVNNRNSLIRSIALGGIIIATLHLIIQQFLFFSLLGKVPFISVEQYIASGALGNAAFTGGLATALLGVFFHYLTSFVIVGVFILSAARIPLLRRNIIVGSLLYGFGVFIVMNFIVLPLSAAPPLPVPTMPQIIELLIEHILVIGLPLGILVRRNANSNK
jgi:hypothetical protein